MKNFTIFNSSFIFTVVVIVVVIGAVTLSIIQINRGYISNGGQNEQDNQDNNTNNQDGSSYPQGGGSNSNEEGDSDSGPNDGSTPGNQNPEIMLDQDCTLIRPGNIPDVTCDVNYIKTDGVSLKISNNIGQELNVKIGLNNCGDEQGKTIQNSQDSDFIFLCNPVNYFEEEISLQYTINDQVIYISGFVTGEVVLS